MSVKIKRIIKATTTALLGAEEDKENNEPPLKNVIKA